MGTTPDINYFASGGSDDWARGEAGIKWVYLMELPDSTNGLHGGFLLPARYIIPTGQSVFQGFRAAISEINNYYYNAYSGVIR